MEQKYYVQDARSFVGNSMLWWKHNDCGYTPDLREAKVFSLLEVSRMHSIQDGTKKAWPKEYIDARQEAHIDMQSCDSSEVFQVGRGRGAGAKAKPTPTPTPTKD